MPPTSPPPGSFADGPAPMDVLGPRQVPPRGGDENDRPPVDDALMECLMEQQQQQPRARRGDDFAPEVVLDFVRSITELQGDDFKQCAPARERPAQAHPCEGQHILDKSLEALNCDPVPVLLPLVVNPRGASDTAVATSLGPRRPALITDERRSVETGLGSQRQSQSSEGDQQMAVIAEALKDIRRHLSPSPQESSEEETPGPSEMEELMKDSSLVSTSEAATSSQESTEDDSEKEPSEAGTEETTEATAQLETGVEGSAASIKSQYSTFQAEANYDLLVPSLLSSLDPIVHHADPLYTIKNAYQGMAQDYSTVLIPQVGGVPQVSDASEKQPISCSTCYDFTNHEYLSQQRKHPGGAFEQSVPPSNRSIDGRQRHVADLLCGDDCHFQAPGIAPQFGLLPLSAELRAAVPEREGASGSSIPPSVDEKSFINFLFSNMSNDDIEDRAGPLDLFQINSNGGFLQDNADVFDQLNTVPLVDYNNNVLGSHGERVYQELAMSDDIGRRADMSAETDATAGRMHTFSETTDVATYSADSNLTRSPPSQIRQPAVQEETLAATQVFRAELCNAIPEFLHSLQEKKIDDAAAEYGHVPPLARPFDVSTEPERNYDLLRLCPERSVWPKARTPFSDGNVLSSTPASEDMLKFRRRNVRNFFSDGNTRDTLNIAGQVEHSAPPAIKVPTSWPLKPVFVRGKEWMRRCAPLKPVFVRQQRRPPMPPPLKPVFLAPQQQQQLAWTTSKSTGNATENSDQEMWTSGISLVPSTTGCVRDDEVDTEDVINGLTEDTAMLQPLLFVSQAQSSQQEPSSSDNSTGQTELGGSSSEEDSNTSTTRTSVNASEESAHSSSTAPAPTQRSIYSASYGTSNHDEQAPTKEPHSEMVASVIGHDISWGLHSEVLLSLAIDELDGSAPSFDLPLAGTGEESTDDVASSFNEAYPCSAKKTLTLRSLMPTIREEDQE